jgi:ATP-dependent DNA helicase PIF1
MLHNRFQPADIFDVPIHTNIPADITSLDSWVQDDRFHGMKQCAIGARVMLKTKLDLSMGASNGATGVVIEKTRDATTQQVTCIKVQLDTGSVIPIRRMSYKHTFLSGARYFKCTFPLTLAYAITGHKAQGATIRNRVFLHVRSGFAPGLLYVMLSRVLTKSQIRLAHPLRAKDIAPVPPKYQQ